MSDVRMPGSETNVRPDESGSMSALFPLLLLFLPPALWRLLPVQHGRGLAVQIPGKENGVA